jgi:hypothetical protein
LHRALSVLPEVLRRKRRLAGDGPPHPCNRGAGSRLDVALANLDPSPSGLPQLRKNLASPLEISTDLEIPELSIPCGSAVVLGTAVPEAPVHEHGNALARDGQIGAAWHGLGVLPVPDAPRMQRGTQPSFGPCVMATDACHDAAPHGVGREVAGHLGRVRAPPKKATARRLLQRLQWKRTNAISL